ncbi:MAG TPA: dienelactone hydrolase family protein [Candidatus Lustribacter sp.]|nr:dienelactone hydrolase family protein [Candidatus Lustribacter sp.]
MTTIDRSKFMGASAAAIAAAGTAPADAQSDYGHPHPPIVPEDDPAITVRHASLTRPDATISAYVAMPKVRNATTPGIVLCAHIWGVDAQYRDLARRFAKLGYIAIAPGLFDRSNPPNGDGQSDTGLFAGAVTALYAGNKMNGDLLAAKALIRTQTPRGKIGIYGNCMGGGIVLQALVGNKDYDAASVLYGYVRADRKATEPPPAGAFDWASQVTTPVIGAYAGLDAGINTADVQAAYAKLGGPHDVTVYPDAKHGFLDDTRASYNSADATAAFAKMTAWYGKYLTTT